jgi:hypothetical protein
MNSIPDLQSDINITYLDNESLDNRDKTNKETIRPLTKEEISCRIRLIQDQFHQFLSHQILTILFASSNVTFFTDHDSCLINDREFIKLPPGEIQFLKTVESPYQFEYLRGMWMSLITNNEIHQWELRLTKFKSIEVAFEKNIKLLNSLRKVHNIIINTFEAGKDKRVLNQKEINEFLKIGDDLKSIAEQVNSCLTVKFSNNFSYSYHINKFIKIIYTAPKEQYFTCQLIDFFRKNKSLLELS